MCYKRSSVWISMALVAVSLIPLTGHAQSYNALTEFGSAQGGTSGVWFYQESDDSTFANLLFNASGNPFTGYQPTWQTLGHNLPVIFKEQATSDGLVFHPGIPAPWTTTFAPRYSSPVDSPNFWAV